ncbi:hypothetical protein [Marinirhabdus gelatinilytica]|uniref:hypothetical protein n=1 Tax=Marinirhabdus gelatinilytica TaxID=1703343 RepID=UPI000E0FD787|nr:hypothetical protein [Marinirhabdus gelatinilytica]
MKLTKINLVITFSIISFLIIGWIILSKFISSVYEMSPNKKASEYYKEYTYSGLVTNKFIDSKQHNYQTVIIQNGEEKDILLLDFETSGLFDFIEVGDSIFKKKSSLKLRLIRSELDTIIEMQIFDKN